MHQHSLMICERMKWHFGDEARILTTPSRVTLKAMGVDKIPA
jgi:hypothetical protein